MEPVGLIVDQRLTIEASLDPLERQRFFPVKRYFAEDSDHLARLCNEAPEQTIVIVPHFRTDQTALRRAILSSGKQVMLLDTFDQTSSPLLPLIDAVDVYAKKAVLRLRHDYSKKFRGNYIFTDWLETHMDITIGDWSFGSVIAEDQMSDRIVSSWNFAAEPRFRKCRAMGRLLARRMRRRSVDLNCRFSAAGSDHAPWYARYREFCLEKAKAALPRFRLTHGRIGARLFFLELCNSKCTFSPFGYGELCLRDVEAICAGSLLIKPNTDHLETSPNLYQSFKTYVPVAWDLSDLEERVAYYLAHPDEASAICDTAWNVLSNYQRHGWKTDVQRVFNSILPAEPPVLWEFSH